jgi:hypothetical protein
VVVALSRATFNAAARVTCAVSRGADNARNDGTLAIVVARWCAPLVVISVAGVTLRATADPAGADRAAADAQVRADAGDFFGAAAKYREAFREQPRPDLMCNVGVAYYKAKDLPRAQRYLDQCLRIGASLDAAFIANVRKVLTAVEQKLASDRFTPLDLAVQPDTAASSLDGGVHDEPIVGSRRIWVPFGSYTLVVHAEGFADQQQPVVAQSAAPLSISVKLLPSAHALAGATDGSASAGSAATRPGPSGAHTGSDSAPPAPSPPRRSLVAPIVASAASGAFGGLALGFYLSARSTGAEAERAATGDSYTALADDARSRQHVSWVIGGAAGVAAVVAGVLWYRATRSPAQVDVSATGSGASASLTLSW